MDETQVKKRAFRKVFLPVWLGLIAVLLLAIFLIGLPAGEEEPIKAAGQSFVTLKLFSGISTRMIVNVKVVSK